MLQPEERQSATDMVILEVREGDHVEEVTMPGPQITPQFLEQLRALLARICLVAHVGEIKEQLLSAAEVDAIRIGVAHRVQSDY